MPAVGYVASYPAPSDPPSSHVTESRQSRAPLLHPSNLSNTPSTGDDTPPGEPRDAATDASAAARVVEPTVKPQAMNTAALRRATSSRDAGETHQRARRAAPPGEGRSDLRAAPARDSDLACARSRPPRPPELCRSCAATAGGSGWQAPGGGGYRLPSAGMRWEGLRVAGVRVGPMGSPCGWGGARS